MYAYVSQTFGHGGGDGGQLHDGGDGLDLDLPALLGVQLTHTPRANLIVIPSACMPPLN